MQRNPLHNIIIRKAPERNNDQWRGTSKLNVINKTLTQKRRDRRTAYFDFVVT